MPTINGRVWTILKHTRRTMPLLNGEKLAGLCHHESNTIHLRKDYVDWRVFEHLIHEVLHAQDPERGESDVDRAATELREILLAHFDVRLK